MKRPFIMELPKLSALVGMMHCRSGEKETCLESTTGYIAIFTYVTSPKLLNCSRQKSRLLEYIYTHICDYNLNRLNIEINTENILRRQDEILSKNQ